MNKNGKIMYTECKNCPMKTQLKYNRCVIAKSNKGCTFSPKSAQDYLNRLISIQENIKGYDCAPQIVLNNKREIKDVRNRMNRRC